MVDCGNRLFENLTLPIRVMLLEVATKDRMLFDIVALLKL
jgi:hypothetical protein